VWFYGLTRNQFEFHSLTNKSKRNYALQHSKPVAETKVGTSSKGEIRKFMPFFFFTGQKSVWIKFSRLFPKKSLPVYLDVDFLSKSNID